MPPGAESNIDSEHKATSSPGDSLHGTSQHSQQQTLYSAEKSFSDGSSGLFAMYLDRAEEEDEKMAENWKGDADGILVFTGLFSAVVATFLGGTYQNLQLNPQNASVFYLAQLYHLSASRNGTTITVPPTVSDPTMFTPTTFTVWVNALWFLSLVISLTCALLATLLQQWARRYLRMTRTRYRAQKRARIRAFFAEGIEKYHVPWAVEALPALLHTSVFLFYAGLVIFLFTIHHTIFAIVLSWVAICASVYIAITWMPVLRQDSPYQTPFTNITWYLTVGISMTLLTVLELGRKPVQYTRRRLKQQLVRGMTKEAEDAAEMQSSAIDSRALAWTLDFLDEDHELEQFVAGIPSFCSSTTLDPRKILKGLDGMIQHDTLLDGIFMLMHRTVGSGSLPAAIRIRRLKICFMAAFTMSFQYPDVQIWKPLVFPVVLRSVECYYIIEESSKSPDQDIAFPAQCVAAITASHAKRYGVEDGALILERRLDIPSPVALEYLSRVTSMRLANLVHFIRHTVLSHLDIASEGARALILKETLQELCHITVNETPPELQHEFCSLWNRIVSMMHKRQAEGIATHILAPLSRVYCSLHMGTDAAPTVFDSTTPLWDYVFALTPSYPMCSLQAHRSHSAASIKSYVSDIHPPLVSIRPPSITVPSFSPSRLPEIPSYTYYPQSFLSAGIVPLSDHSSRGRKSFSSTYRSSFSSVALDIDAANATAFPLTDIPSSFSRSHPILAPNAHNVAPSADPQAAFAMTARPSIDTSRISSIDCAPALEVLSSSPLHGSSLEANHARLPTRPNSAGSMASLTNSTQPTKPERLNEYTDHSAEI